MIGGIGIVAGLMVNRSEIVIGSPGKTSQLLCFPSGARSEFPRPERSSVAKGGSDDCPVQGLVTGTPCVYDPA
jgi:hypothetical protein